MFDACLLLGPSVTSNETFWPSLRVLKPCIWMAEKCAKRSSLPSSGVMNPYPFASLNHFTVPVAMLLTCLLLNGWSPAHRSVQGARSSKGDGILETKLQGAFYAGYRGVSIAWNWGGRERPAALPSG